MFICIEPLFQISDDEIALGEDGWTVFSKNFRLNAHFEHTIKINKNSVEILTNYE
jgi:methionyl aminopeptidase